MADLFTSNLSLVRPETGASQDTWGGKYNENASLVDEVFDPDGNGTPVGLNVGVGKVLGLDGSARLWGSEVSSVGEMAKVLLPFIYPVGSLYYNASRDTNPAELLGFGEWELWGAGRVPVCVDASDDEFKTVGLTGGSKDAAVIAHDHEAVAVATSKVTDLGHKHGISPMSGANCSPGEGKQPWRQDAGGTKDTELAYSGIAVSTTVEVAVQTRGGSGAGANLQPYISCFVWRRTA